MARPTIRWGRIVLIALVCAVVDLVLHGFGPKQDFKDIHMPGYDVLARDLATTPWFLPVLILTFFLTFALLATMFSLVQERLPGSRLCKGFRYGICFWVLWAFGILEWHYIYDSSWEYDLFNTAFLDGGFMFIVGLLSGRFLGTDSPASAGQKAGLAVVPIIAILFLAGRYFNYTVMNLVSAQQGKSLITFVCLALVGIWIGCMYYLLRPGIAHQAATHRALFFAVLLFGTNWWFFAQFEPMLMKISLADPILRVGVDIIMAAVGVLIYEKAVLKQP